MTTCLVVNPPLSKSNGGDQCPLFILPRGRMFMYDAPRATQPHHTHRLTSLLVSGDLAMLPFAVGLDTSHLLALLD